MIDFAANPFGAIFSVVTTAVSLASAVAAITKTPADDTAVGKIYRIIDLFALNIGRAKQMPRNSNLL